MKMKKIFSILSFLLSSMIVFSSCHREDIPCNDPETGYQPIIFSAVNALLETKSEAPAGFKVWASRTHEVNSASQTDYNIFGATGTNVQKSGSGTSVTWTYTPVRYWQSGAYNFFAVAPVTLAEGELTSDGLELDFGTNGWDITSNQTDLLFATSTVSNDVVPLKFDHLLTKITFSAKKATTAPIDITSIKISGHHKVAEGVVLSGDNTEWDLKDDLAVGHEIISSTPITLSGTASKITSDVLVFPEDCALTVEVTIRHNKIGEAYQKTAEIDGSGWLSGKQYDYIINVTPGSIVISSAQVKDWVTDRNDNNENDDDITHDFE